MSFTELALSRRSIRKYKNTPVKREDLEKCVESARYAPSACNSQPWKFIIIDETDLLEKLKKDAFLSFTGMNKFVSDCTAMILVLSFKEKLLARTAEKVRRTSFRKIDTGIVAAYLVLQAHQLGIGSCILGWFKERKIKQILGIPRSAKVELAISMGIPSEKPKKEKHLKKKEETVAINSY